MQFDEQFCGRSIGANSKMFEFTNKSKAFS